jgi:hypothetical protein
MALAPGNQEASTVAVDCGHRHDEDGAALALGVFREAAECKHGTAAELLGHRQFVAIGLGGGVVVRAVGETAFGNSGDAVHWGALLACQAKAR